MKKILLFSLFAILSYIGFFWYTLPDVKLLNRCIQTSLYQADLCSTGSSYVSLSQVNKRMIDALIVSEDSNFFHHNGFDLDEIKNSFEKNLQTMRFARGASTLTQQLVKNVFLTNEKSITRKLREAILTYQVEKSFTKNLILEKYLNVVEFGPGVYGVKKASQFYFNKDSSTLTALEAAYLVHLLPNPKAYSRGFFQKKLSRFNRNSILVICYRLMKYKKISLEEYEQAQAHVDQFPWDGKSANPIVDSNIIRSDEDLESVEDQLDRLEQVEENSN